MDQTADSYVIDPKTGEKNALETKVKIKKGEYDGYPYLDTFKYWHPDHLVYYQHPKKVMMITL
jgi:hypothetical protein